MIANKPFAQPFAQPFVNITRTSSQSVIPITWLFRDEFTTDEAAPLASPRTAEPGPGTWTFTSTTDVGISNSELRIEGTAEVFVTGPTITRATGLMVAARLRRLTTPGGGNNRVYFSPAGSTNLSLGLGKMTEPSNSVIIDGNSGLPVAIAVEGKYYRFVFVAMSSGWLYFIDAHLVWVRYNSAGYAQPYIERQVNRAHMGVDWVRARQLPAPFDSDYGIASVNETTPTSGTSYTATADAIHDLTLTAPNPLADSAGLRYRYTDDDNCWHAYFNSSGTARLDSVSGGAATNRISVTSAIGAGNTRTLRAIADGSLHDLYTLSSTTWTKRGSQVDVSHLNSNTAIRPYVTGAWTLGALRSYPRTSPAYAELDRT